ncbi:ATP-binding protein [Quadrisphaera sp. DSM 44207]|uniref:ATP-binding protein n=1 Tax=Quadrisphaera sp. DSM 44207 TaxID=1881057 RepID=UPI000885158F|nr:ATP-binding protein [Quadrisphaera sp. DSM 44207]SDQ08592.1 serine/threonine-protein kinase RsbW [Quadrisphaera sp. DSM 44207]
MAAADGSSTPADRVELRVPADPAYLAVLRTATAGLAARLDLTLDEIEDLRIAVDEACALVLGEAGEDGATRARPGDTLLATFDLGPDGLSVQVSGPAQDLPSRSSFAWAVLEALVGSLHTGVDDEGRRSIRLEHGGSRRTP